MRNIKNTQLGLFEIQVLLKTLNSNFRSTCDALGFSEVTADPFMSARRILENISGAFTLFMHGGSHLWKLTWGLRGSSDFLSRTSVLKGRSSWNFRSSCASCERTHTGRPSWPVRKCCRRRWGPQSDADPGRGVIHVWKQVKQSVCAVLMDRWWTLWRRAFTNAA